MKTKLTLIITLLFCQISIEAQAFVTEWNTMNTTEIVIPTTGGGYNYDVYWEEIDNPTNNGSLIGVQGNAEISNLFSNTDYRIEITGQFPRIYINGLDAYRNKLRKLTQWGDIEWLSFQNAFKNAALFDISAIDTPRLSKVISLENMFENCQLLKGVDANWNWNISNIKRISHMFNGAISFNQTIGSWTMSNVTYIHNMFQGATAFNQPIDSWDLSNVISMSHLFYGATAFNQPIGSWNTTNVKNMRYLFFGATSFNQPLGSWNTENVTSMYYMFYGAISFNQDISTWNTRFVNDMHFMFYGASSFNQNIGSWNTGRVKDMRNIFYGATSFNGDINSWDVSRVENMYGMFNKASAFNQDISSWDVSKVKNMNDMFYKAISFNQDISSWKPSSALSMVYMFSYANVFNQDISAWDVGKVINMSYMFYGANSFNQNIESWNLSNVTNMENMLDNSGISCENYGKTLRGWVNNPSTPDNIILGSNTLLYSESAKAYRDILVDSKNWTINGDELDASCAPLNTSTPPLTQFKIYPNPAEEVITISSTQPITFIRIVDFLGRQVYYSEISNKSDTFQIRLPEQKGVYYVIVKCGEQEFIEKVVKM